MMNLEDISGKGDSLTQRLLAKRLVTTDMYTARRHLISPIDPKSDKRLRLRAVRFYYSNPTPVISNVERRATLENSKSPLLRLPAELRLMVFEEALRPPKGFVQHESLLPKAGWFFVDEEWWSRSGTPLIFTCKQIYTEALAIAHKNYTFNVEDLPEKCDVVLVPVSPRFFWNKDRADRYDGFYWVRRSGGFF